MPLQYLFPVYNASDSLNEWINQTGASGNAYSYINEGVATPTDNDYVVYTTGASTTPEITLGRLMVVPSSITLSHRMSGIGSITSILLRDTNNLTIASTTGVQSLSGNFTTRTVTMSGVNLDTRNYANAHLLINFSGTPNDIAISAIDMNVSGTLNTVNASKPFYIYSARKAYFPPQFGEGGFNSGYSSGFGNDEDLFPLYINSTAFCSGNIDLFVGQYNTIRIRPSGDSYVNDWISSSGTTTGLWEYVNQPTDSTLPDDTYIYNYQSGVVNNPSYLYMIGDSGIYRCDLNGSGIETISESSYLYSSVTNGCYNPIDDTIFYGLEVGTTKSTSEISINNFVNSSLSTNIGGGLGFDIKDNILYSLSKYGTFYKSEFNGTETALATLAGSVREMPNRRLRVDHINRKIYAVTQDRTSMLSRLHCYDIDSPGWTQLRTLSHGIYGGAFDIDFNNSGIYYAATSGDLTSTAFYGIVKENMYSGAGTRIINPGGSSFFQCNELILDNVHDKLYYVGQNNSGSSLEYDIVKTNLDGSSPTTILSIPEASGANVLLVDGGIHKSYIDFDLTDFSEDFGNPTNPNKQIADCYVSIEAMNNAPSGFAFVTAKVLDASKSINIWQPSSRGSGVFLGGQVEASGYKIGLGNGYITSVYNNNVMWNNSVLRLELASYNPDNSGDFRIYNAEAILTSAANPVESSSVDLYVYGKDLSTDSIPLTTLAGASIASIDLYTFTATPISSGIESYIKGYGTDNSGISLYTRSAQTKTSSLNMYLSVRTPQYYSGDITFVTEGNDVPKGVKSLPLFAKVDGSDSGVYGKMNLYTLGYGAYDITARMNLYMNCTAPQYSSGIDLFVYNTRDYASGVLSMYMHVKSGVQGSLPVSGDMPLFIQRSIESDAHRLNLYIPGPSGETGTTTLYITGANISSSGISMVIPDVLGTNSGITKLYVNGF